MDIRQKLESVKMGLHLCSTSLLNGSAGGLHNNMTIISKTLLGLSATGIVAGSIIDFSGFNVNPSWMVALPSGAVFLGLFMISVMMEKEMAAFDAEEAGRLQLALIKTPAPAPRQNPELRQAAIPNEQKASLHEH
jgi:hypothetical protein